MDVLWFIVTGATFLCLRMSAFICAPVVLYQALTETLFSQIFHYVTEKQNVWQIHCFKAGNSSIQHRQHLLFIQNGKFLFKMQIFTQAKNSSFPALLEYETSRHAADYWRFICILRCRFCGNISINANKVEMVMPMWHFLRKLITRVSGYDFHHKCRFSETGGNAQWSNVFSYADHFGSATAHSWLLLMLAWTLTPGRVSVILSHWLELTLIPWDRSVAVCDFAAYAKCC